VSIIGVGSAFWGLLVGAIVMIVTTVGRPRVSSPPARGANTP
jgi:benzoate membrane transport protein